MRLRSFFAKDMKEALAAMRAEMGDEAIMVASEKMKDGSILLRAGLEEEHGPPPSIPQQLEPQPAPSAAAMAQISPLDARYREGLVARLRGPKVERPTGGRAFDRPTLTSMLRAHRTPERIAQMLAEDAENSGLPDLTLALASALDRFMRNGPADAKHRGTRLLVGPPGAGKTAVAARLAAQHCLAGDAVRLAATDLETAGQLARLENFAACLGVPVLPAETPESLRDAIDDARAANALLIADSAGCDPREPLSRELVGFLSMGSLDIIGVISSASDAEEAGEIAAALAKLGASSLIVTGLDLARRKGTLVALACSGLSVAHVAASPYLADGLKPLTPLALARAVLANLAAAVDQKVA